MAIYLFDLDMTLIDTGSLAELRAVRSWGEVRRQLPSARAFPLSGNIHPHQVPAHLRAKGHTVGIVTSSPRWYARELASSFKIEYDVLVAYEDTNGHKPDPEPITKALENLGATDSGAAFYIGDDVDDFEAAYHAGIVSVGAGWGLSSISKVSSAAPDVLIRCPSVLLEDLELYRYMGELGCAGVGGRLHWGSMLPCSDSDPIHALGRYFTASDPRHSASELSNLILRLKTEDGPADCFAQILAIAVQAMEKTPDFIVAVPPKPSQTRNRFAHVLSLAEPLLPDDCEIEPEGLRCDREVPNYKLLGGHERPIAIQGAFVSNFCWDQGIVLLIDDVLTTESTVAECRRVLKANGASEVYVLTLAKDQHAYVRKHCSACCRVMKIRTNSKTLEKFWGCSGYPDHCQHTENLT